MIASLPVAMFARVRQRETELAFCDEVWPGGASQRYVYSIVIMVLQAVVIMVLQYFLPSSSWFLRP